MAATPPPTRPTSAGSPGLTSRSCALPSTAGARTSAPHGRRAVRRPDDVARRLLEVARRHAERPADLRLLDERRLLEPDWLQHRGCSATPATPTGSRATSRGRSPGRPPHRPRRHPPAPDAAAGHPRGRQRRRVCRRRLPHGPPRPRHHRRPADLATRLRERGISLVVDPCQPRRPRAPLGGSGRAGDASYRDRFLVFPDRELPDAYERTLPEVFPDFAPGASRGTTTSRAGSGRPSTPWQWDLNWANPDVLVEIADVVLELANLGVEVFRLDAIASCGSGWHRLPEPARRCTP